MNTEQERADFEAWANGRCELHLVNPAGRYLSAITQFAWEAYQAGRAAQPAALASAPVAGEAVHQQRGGDVEAVLRLFLTGDGFIAECDIPHIVAALTAQPAVNGYTCTVPDDCETLHWRGQILSMNELASMAQPTVGEEIMVNAAHDVYTLPLRPSGLSSGPRFVVHVPGPEQPAAVDEAMVFRLAVWMATQDGHDDPHRMIWEGSPPVPWGEVWNRYEYDARAALTAALAAQYQEPTK